MANLDGTLENKTIVFTEKDLLLNTWRLQVSSTNPRSLSLLIKAALRHYIRTNSFCCVGRVCIKYQNAEAVKKHTVCMSLTNSQDIISWLQESRRVGVSQTVMIKSVLMRSIEVVDDENQVWIPSPIEIVEIANLRQGRVFQENAMISQRAYARPVVEHVPQLTVKHDDFMNDDAAKSEAGMPAASGAGHKSEDPLQQRNEKRKKPRAAALRGMHYK